MRIRAKITLKNYEIEERRKKLGYTQAEFADIVGMKLGDISEIELLKRKPTEEQAKSIALELDADVAVLFPQGYQKIVDVFNKRFDSVVDYTAPLLESDETLLLEQADAKLTVQNLIKDLPEKYRDIIEMRQGLVDGEPKNLEEVGKKYGVTRERIRQIEEKGYELMRQRAKELNLQS